MKIIDCFPFYNELDMLEYRLRLLSPYIDHFILVEADFTYRGNPKPLLYEENKDRFAEFADKIVHIAVSGTPVEDPWTNEYHQRNSISLGIAQLDLAGSDYLLICDTDEIPDPAYLTALRLDPRVQEEMGTFSMYMYYYNTATMFDFPCGGAKFVTKRTLEARFENTPQKARNDIRAVRESSRRLGWHMSYFGNVHFISNKIQQFSHSEFDLPEYTSPPQIQHRVDQKQDLFDRPVPTHQKLPAGTVLPPQIMLSTGKLWPPSHCEE